MFSAVSAIYHTRISYLRMLACTFMFYVMLLSRVPQAAKKIPGQDLRKIGPNGSCRYFLGPYFGPDVAHPRAYCTVVSIYIYIYRALSVGLYVHSYSVISLLFIFSAVSEIYRMHIDLHTCLHIHVLCDVAQ